VGAVTKLVADLAAGVARARARKPDSAGSPLGKFFGTLAKVWS